MNQNLLTFECVYPGDPEVVRVCTGDQLARYAVTRDLPALNLPADCQATFFRCRILTLDEQIEIKMMSSSGLPTSAQYIACAKKALLEVRNYRRPGQPTPQTIVLTRNSKRAVENSDIERLGLSADDLEVIGQSVYVHSFLVHGERVELRVPAFLERAIIQALVRHAAPTSDDQMPQGD